MAGLDVTLTPALLGAELARLGDRAAGAEGDRLAARVREWLGPEALAARLDPQVEEPTAAWAIEAPGETRVRVVADDGSFTLPLVRLGSGDLFAGAAALESGTAFRWRYEVAESADDPWTEFAALPEDARGMRGPARTVEVYAVHPDCMPQPGVPRGTLTAHTGYRSRLFAGTTRDWWVYVPAQYTPDEPACVMVFQDGGWAQAFLPPFFDNLIARGDMPVTVGVFVNPGVLDDGGSNRSFEYDTLSDQYARFLLEEILPEVGRAVRLREDPASRAIAGMSSGGICAFTAAWERPDAFRKVLSFIGSFADIRGGHNYPPMIRKRAPKPIRVFLQGGKNDLNVAWGDWWLANLEMASALRFAGYDVATAWGNGFHTPSHGYAILQDALRWLWRGHRG